MATRNQIKQDSSPDDFNYEVGKVFTEVRGYYLDYFGRIEKEIAERISGRTSEESTRTVREQGSHKKR